MLVLFFFVCSLIGLLISMAKDAIISAVIDSIISKAIAMITALVTALPWGNMLLSTVDLDSLQGKALSEAVLYAADHRLIGPIVGQTLSGISFLQLQENGKLKDLFVGASSYSGMSVDQLSTLGSAQSGQNIPVLLVDTAKVKPNIKIVSPGPVFIYGEKKASLNVQSKMGIFLANESFSAAGSELDSPLVVASQLPEGNDITIRNSQSEDHLVRLIPFSEVRGVAKTWTQKLLKGEPIQNAFKFDDLGQQMESMPTSVPQVPVPPPTTRQILKKTKCEMGFFFLRCHVRFDRATLQSFVNKFATPDVTSWNVEMWGANLQLGVHKPRVFAENSQIRLFLDVNVKNKTPLKADSDASLLQRLAGSAYQTALQSIPNLQIGDVEVVIDKVRYERSSGELFVEKAHIKDFKVSVPLATEEQVAWAKNFLLNVLNEMIPRYLATNPIYNLSDVKVFGFLPLAKLLLERVDIDPHDHLRVQARFGPQIFKSRERECNGDLLN